MKEIINLEDMNQFADDEMDVMCEIFKHHMDKSLDERMMIRLNLLSEKGYKIFKIK